jgi:hypothetical protein
MLDPNIPNPLSAAHAESPSRRHVSPWAIVGGVVAAGLLAWGLFAAVVIVLHPSEPPPAKARTGQDFTMPDGTILTLETVTFGKRHEFEVDLGMEPRGFWSWTKRPSKRTVAMTAPKDMLGLWLTRRNPISGQALPFEWWQKCVAVDDNGCEITDEWAGFDICGFHRRSSTSGSRPWGAVSLDKQEKYIAHSILRPFRNNGKEFVLRVYDTAGTKSQNSKPPHPSFPRRPNGCLRHCPRCRPPAM